VHQTVPWLQQFEGSWATVWVLKKAVNQRVSDARRPSKRVILDRAFYGTPPVEDATPVASTVAISSSPGPTGSPGPVVSSGATPTETAGETSRRPGREETEKGREGREGGGRGGEGVGVMGVVGVRGESVPLDSCGSGYHHMYLSIMQWLRACLPNAVLAGASLKALATGRFRPIRLHYQGLIMLGMM